MRRLLLILNGKSAQREDVRGAVERVRGEGCEIRVRVTYDGDDAAQFAREAVRLAGDARPQVIVAGGGDGTVNQVVAAALEADPATDCAFGVLPLGTANDFATGLGLPVDDAAAALALCAAAAPRRIDVGRINGRVFVNVASGGSVTRITRETDPRAKRLLGGAAYLIAGASRIGELAPTRAAFAADGFSWEGDFIAMAIGNGRLAGGGVPLCAEARVDDGRLDLTLFPQPDADNLMTLLSGLLREPGSQFDGYARKARFTRLTIEAEEDLALNLDGEPMSARRLDVQVDPAALSFITGK
ncbi:lipid kinase YegS [Stappia sp. TSB10GB4]|uniref:lipid kinase YegS n=1 Tax=Stappia sp. TSB10GB4 TaxID=2003584 RepID=UPI0016475A16|nr:lipid kinase YegS [Stappia sp. TSB10GB4]